MNEATRTFNLGIYHGGNKIKQNKNSIYRGIPEDKEIILKELKCRFNHSLTLPDTARGQKNLIYFCVFNAEYTVLFELLLKSLIKNTDITKFDILIISDEVTKKMLLALDPLNNFSYNFLIVNTPSDGVEASMFKLNIFDYLNIDAYKTILFLDTDIICLKDITFLFDKNDNYLDVVSNNYNFLKKNKNMDVNIYSAATITHSLCYFLKEDKEYISNIDPDVFNAGQYLFKNSSQMKNHFDNVRWLVKIWPSVYFYEQSFLNHYFVLNKICKYSTLNENTKIILSANITDKKTVDWEQYETGPFYSLLHFAGCTLKARTKLELIRNYLNKYSICL